MPAARKQKSPTVEKSVEKTLVDKIKVDDSSSNKTLIEKKDSNNKSNQNNKNTTNPYINKKDSNDESNKNDENIINPYTNKTARKTNATSMQKFLNSPVGSFEKKNESTSDENSEEEQNRSQNTNQNKIDSTVPSFFKKTTAIDSFQDNDRRNQLIMWLLCKHHNTAAIAFTFQHIES